MNIAIYQIDMDRDKDRVAFENLDMLKKYQGSAEVNSSIYDKVFEGKVDCHDLEDVYLMFNRNHPEDYTGRSLSVSDVIEVWENGKSTFHYCDSIGFQEIAFQPPLNHELRSMTAEERTYAYSQSWQIISQTGCIGYLRADMDSNGLGFYTSWNDFRDDLKTPQFKSELDQIINSLRKTSFLQDRKALTNYCYAHPEASCGNDREWGVRVDTASYSFLMRLNPNRGEYNMYCYCYKRDWLQQHMEQARHGIRFVTPNYEEKFRLKDGDQVRIITPDNKKMDQTARYIDDYHVELGWGSGATLYHISEFAERMDREGNKVIPLRSSLPEKCFVYVESTDEIGIVERGETGYRPAGVKPGDGVSKRRGVEYLNNAQGITKAQAAAMSAGSLFGWETKAADPANYDAEGNALGRIKNRHHETSPQNDPAAIAAACAGAGAEAAAPQGAGPDLE